MADPDNEAIIIESDKEKTSGPVELLANGLISQYEEPLKSIQGALKELTNKQYTIYKNIHQQNLQLSEAYHSSDINEMFNKIKIYQEKVQNIQKRMTNLHIRASKLKKRTVQLELQKEKEFQLRAQQREREEQLIGK